MNKPLELLAAMKLLMRVLPPLASCMGVILGLQMMAENACADGAAASSAASVSKPRRALMPFENMTSPAPGAWVAGRDYATNRLVVKFKESVQVRPSQTGGAKTQNGPLNAVLEQSGVVALSPVYTGGSRALAPAGAASGNNRNWHRALLAPGAEPMEAARSIGKDPNVEWAEPEFMRQTSDFGMAGAPGKPMSMQGGGDPLAGQQWHLNATRTREAWAHLQGLGIPAGGRSDVVVAVIDTGVDYNHPDLAANMWTNSREIPGNGRDDDSDGLADDVHGASFVFDHNGNPMDDNGHGTHVAGIVASAGNNGSGGIGVAHNVRIMALKAANYLGGLTSADSAECILYAVAHGADVINMSYGGPAPSRVEEEALAIAFSHTILVASAGNHGMPNRSPPHGEYHYPADYNWVLGVMASDPEGHLAGFSNWDYQPNDEHEYEIAAPGVDILSTYPGGQYLSMNGTSMASPVVAGIAALARSKFWDKETYSSRFIMGQLASTGVKLDRWKQVDALNALTQTPSPNITFLAQMVFDGKDIDSGNDADGIADAGETIHLGIALRNQWGKAGQVVVKIAPQLETGGADPYAAMTTDTVDFGSIGAFSSGDNGISRDKDGAMQGVSNPFRLRISNDCTNDHAVRFALTATYRNAMDPADSKDYVLKTNFVVLVQRGRNLPDVISEDMTLTKDNLYIVNNKTVLVDSQATLTIMPGTQIQFGAPVTMGEYVKGLRPAIVVKGNMICAGSAEEPVEMFTWGDVPWVNISEINGGKAILSYARIINPKIDYSASIDHCEFVEGHMTGWGGANIVSETISNSRFQYLHGTYAIYGKTDDVLQGNLFNRCSLSMSKGGNSQYGLNNAVAGNAFVNCYDYDYSSWWATNLAASQFTIQRWFDNALDVTWLKGYYPTNVILDGRERTYFLVTPTIYSKSFSAIDYAEQYARNFGGHLATIRSSKENSFIQNWMSQLNADRYAIDYPSASGIYTIDSGLYDWAYWIGLKYKYAQAQFYWLSGEPVTFTNNMNILAPKYSDTDGAVVFNKFSGLWDWMDSQNRHPCIAEVPGKLNQKQIDAAHEDIIAGILKVNSVFKHNAFLNVLSDKDNARWMKLVSNAGAEERRRHYYITDNYWGTQNPALIEGSLSDFRTDFNKALFIYDPILTTAPSDCYPFADKVVLNAGGRDDLSVVGVGPVEFKVHFNRDMDASIQPEVSFGPGSPFLANTVTGSWISPRVWSGVFNISKTTGDCSHYMRISGAVAAGDPWLVTGVDEERFAFKIVTYGAESMDLQAVGGENCVNLNWMQDEFDLLAGYNLYRSTNPTNNFSRVNSYTIPYTASVYRDTNVAAGTIYYYKFAVVTSDMAETRFSHVAQASALDTIAPVIRHVPVSQALPGLPLNIVAQIEDNGAVAGAWIYCRAIGAADYAKNILSRVAGSKYACSIDASMVKAPGLEYYLEASDGLNIARSGRAAAPYAVSVSSMPSISMISPVSGPAAGGTEVHVYGANFNAGTTIYFGGVLATGIAVVNDHQLTCATPAHFPEMVDVKAVNLDAQSSVLLQAFAFEGDAAVLSMASMAASPGEAVALPILLVNGKGLAAMDLSITYDPTLMQLRGVQAGSFTGAWAMAVNTSQAGVLRLSIANPGTVSSGSGSIAVLSFEMAGTEGASAVCHFASASLNGGVMPVQLSDGRILITRAKTHDLGGKVVYGLDGTPVSDVRFELQGSQQYSAASDAAGLFKFTAIPTDAYALTPMKNDGVRGISAYDASMILRHAAGLIQLSGPALIAADADCSGAVDGMDAYYVLQKAVDAITLPFPHAGVVWTFAPKSRAIGWLTNDQAGLDFSAVLLGEVSGNWSRPGGVESGSSLGAGGAAIRPFSMRALPSAQATGGTNQMAVAIWPRASDGRIRVVFRAGGPVYSVEMKITGLQNIKNRCSGFMMNSQGAADGVVRAAMAGAIPLNGCGVLFEGDLIPGRLSAPVLDSVVVNEGQMTAFVEADLSAFRADTDGDGQDDLSEIAAGTDACNAGSILKLLRVEMRDGSRRIHWSSVPGKKYLLERRRELFDGQWQPVGDPVTALDYEAGAMDPDGSDEIRFYRVTVVDD